jgi:hypothetical protein
MNMLFANRSGRQNFHDPSGLNAQRIDHEKICADFIVEGVQVESDPVVIARIISIGYGCLNFFRLTVQATECQVNMLLIIGQICFCFLRWRQTEIRLYGFEIRNIN